MGSDYDGQQFMVSGMCGSGWEQQQMLMLNMGE